MEFWLLAPPLDNKKKKKEEKRKGKNKVVATWAWLEFDFWSVWIYILVYDFKGVYKRNNNSATNETTTLPQSQTSWGRLYECLLLHLSSTHLKFITERSVICDTYPIWGEVEKLKEKEDVTARKKD